MNSLYICLVITRYSIRFSANIICGFIELINGSYTCASKGYVRILDVSGMGDGHALVYQCDLMLGDGSCDQDQESVIILMRRREDMSEDARTHVRELLRNTCMEPGDFVTINHNSKCLR